jgi:uncharacterized membrane protein YphA (DoxX/SURF4 family)
MLLSAAKALALCRIGFGLYFLAQAWDKTAKGWLSSGAPLANGLFGNPAAQPPSRGFAANAEPFYRSFLESTVQPNALLFSQLVTIGEWVAGLLLVLGLLTRLGSLVSIWLVLNFMLMKGMVALNGSSDRLFILASLAFLLGSAGLAWGLDGAWRHWLAGNPLTRWLAGIPEGEEAVLEPGRVPARQAVRAS